MSEKIILTREQADAIELLIHEAGKDSVLSLHAKSVWLTDKYKKLNGLSISDVAKALYIGYEVEPEFKPNDYVIYADGKVGQYFPVPKGYAQQMPVRHATPEEIAEEKERRFWNKNGRDVWGLRKRDVLRSKNSGQIVEVEYVTNNEEDGHKVRVGLEAWKDIEVIKRNYDVLWFAEDRKDVKVSD